MAEAFEERKAYGLVRTVCACKDCTDLCECMPGYLAVDDLDRMHKGIAPEMSQREFARKYLLASPGARLLDQRTGAQVVIPTLVPARQKDGSCIFLENGKCKIHAIAPFGCAFFDTHMDDKDANDGSMKALWDIAAAKDNWSPYYQVWSDLTMMSLKAPPPAEGRAKLADKTYGPVLPFTPQPLAELRNRVAAAWEKPVGRGDAHLIERTARYVFDSEDGLRLCIYRVVAPIVGGPVFKIFEAHGIPNVFDSKIHGQEFAKLAVKRYSEITDDFSVPPGKIGSPRKALHYTERGVMVAWPA